MALTFNYAILKAIPDARRGERVNVGIVVFLPDGLDVRFHELAKIRALAIGDWSDYAERVERKFIDAFSGAPDAREICRRFCLVESVIRISEIAWFSIIHEDAYENQVLAILEALVRKPLPEKRERVTRINTEIAREFRKTNSLATTGEGLDEHKIVPNFYISRGEELKADFALKNGVMHAAATLDLRKTNVGISQAALPALILDMTAKLYGPSTKRIGVYAAPRDTVDRFSPHIKILKDYSEFIYNWQNPTERSEFINLMNSAIARSRTTLP